MPTVLAVYALAFVIGIAIATPRKKRVKPTLPAIRYDESTAPLAPRSYKVKNPTLRQIRENDLPRYVGSDGVVRTIRQDENGDWV